MRFKKYITFSLFLWTYHAIGMQQTPGQQIPVKDLQEFANFYTPLTETSILYDQEISRFKSYDFEHPEKFREILRKNLGYPNVINYLSQLQKFASLLLYQHIFMQLELDKAFYFYYDSFIRKKIIERQEALGTKEVKEETNKTWILPIDISAELANLIILHIDDLAEKNYLKLRPDIILWILSDDKDTHNYGLALKSYLERKEVRKIATRINETYGAFAALTLLPENSSVFILKASLIGQNLNLFVKAVEVEQEYRRKEQARKGATASIFRDYLNKIHAIANTYAKLWQEYKKLYEIIRNEIREIINAEIKTNPSQARTLLEFNKVSIANTIPSNPLWPTTLPNSLPEFKHPEDHIKLFTLDDELEKMYQEIKKTAPKKVVTKKLRKKPKKKIAPVVVPEVVEQSIKEPEIIAEAPDGSFMLEGDETNEKIIITNPQHSTTEIIYKTDRPNTIQEKLTPHYTEWVNQWWQNPQQALIDQGYTKENTKKFTPLNLRWQPVILHAFSQLVDSFIQKYGQKTEVPNRRKPAQLDTLITLPGEIIYYDNAGNEKWKSTGIYTYLIDSSNGEWYHRMFEPQTGKQLVNSLFEKGFFSPEMKGYYEVAFPPLPAAKK